MWRNLVFLKLLCCLSTKSYVLPTKFSLNRWFAKVEELKDANKVLPEFLPYPLRALMIYSRHFRHEAAFRCLRNRQLKMQRRL